MKTPFRLTDSGFIRRAGLAACAAWFGLAAAGLADLTSLQEVMEETRPAQPASNVNVNPAPMVAPRTAQPSSSGLPDAWGVGDAPTRTTDEPATQPAQSAQPIEPAQPANTAADTQKTPGTRRNAPPATPDSPLFLDAGTAPAPAKTRAAVPVVSNPADGAVAATPAAANGAPSESPALSKNPEAIPAPWGGNASVPEKKTDDDVDFVNVGAHAVPMTKADRPETDVGDPRRVLPWSDTPAQPATAISHDGIWGTIPFAQQASYQGTADRGPGFSVQVPAGWATSEMRLEVMSGSSRVYTSPDGRSSFVVTVFPFAESIDLKGLVSQHTPLLFSSYKVRMGHDMILGKRTGVGLFLEGIRNGTDMGCHFFLCRYKNKGYLVQAYYEDASSAREAAKIMNTVRIF